MSKADLYYQIALAQYQEQHRRSAGSDARAAAMMAVAATLAGIGAVILKDFTGRSTLSFWTSATTALLAFAFIGAAGSAIAGLRPRRWSVSPVPRTLASHLHSPDYEEAGLTEWVGDGLATSVAHNEVLLVAKARAVIAAAVCVGAMTVLVIALAVFVNVGL